MILRDRGCICSIINHSLRLPLQCLRTPSRPNNYPSRNSSVLCARSPEMYSKLSTLCTIKLRQNLEFAKLGQYSDLESSQSHHSRFRPSPRYPRLHHRQSDHDQALRHDFAKQQVSDVQFPRLAVPTLLEAASKIIVYFVVG